MSETARPDTSLAACGRVTDAANTARNNLQNLRRELISLGCDE
ncbi:hypothetical protein [Methylocystis parvus]